MKGLSADHGPEQKLHIHDSVKQLLVFWILNVLQKMLQYKIDCSDRILFFEVTTLINKHTLLSFHFSENLIERLSDIEMSEAASRSEIC